MKRIAACGIALTFLVLSAACGDDPVKPGTLEVNWKFPLGGSCAPDGAVPIDSIQATALRGTEVIDDVSVPCVGSSGTISIEALNPATYDVEVAAVTGGGVRAWLADTRVGVPDGGVGVSDEVTLVKQNAMLMVDWRWPSGLRCASVGVEQVTAVLTDSSHSPLTGFEQTVDCEDSQFEHPLTGETTFGVLFTDIPPDDGIRIKLFGVATDQSFTHKNDAETSDLEPGELDDRFSGTGAILMEECTDPNCGV